ncbi:hypothetical protein V500_05294 [Pseudogymnoascus sp. VKM F-4518 (FW-2643)]|nr:hypothetical protein V500_05294 [Pseudogymnoascus sp. VKM F-4518 (FW-2643)]
MSVNNVGLFFPNDNNLGNVFDDQEHGGYQVSMDYSFPPNQNDNQSAPEAAMSGISHPDNFYEGQISEPGHISFGQDAELEFNPYALPQIDERLHSHTPTPTLDNNNSQHYTHTAYSHNQNFQPRQNRGFGRGPSFGSSSDMSRSRTGRGILPPRLPESSTGVDFNNMVTGNEDMVPYNFQAPTSIQAVDNGRSGATNTAQAGRVGRKFRRSPSNMAPAPYDNQNGFLSGQHLDMQSVNSANTALNVGHSNGIFRAQTEVEGWTRDQNHKYGDTPSSGHAHEHFPALANYGADEPDDSDTGENSDGTVGLPNDQESLTVGSTTVQGSESLAGDDRTSRPEMRRRGSEPMSSRQFRGHSDRAAHRTGVSQQKVGKPLGRRSKGATDPVNIEIVNWYDNYSMSFQDIAQRLNSRQEIRGMPGTFTPNSIHNRYNRCAPIIYRAHGRVFVAIKDRKKHAPEELDAMSNGSHSIEWNPLKDQFLKGVVEEYEASKWSRVAAAFTAATGERVSARTVATRFGMM